MLATTACKISLIFVNSHKNTKRTLITKPQQLGYKKWFRFSRYGSAQQDKKKKKKKKR